MGWLRVHGRHDGIGWRDALLGLALFAAVVRALIPQGFMPVFERGHVSIVICSEAGARTVDADSPSRSSLSDAMASVHAPCAFAALATLAPPPSAPIVSLPAAIETGRVAVDTARRPASRTDFRPQAPRGPPVLQA